MGRNIRLCFLIDGAHVMMRMSVCTFSAIGVLMPQGKLAAGYTRNRGDGSCHDCNQSQHSCGKSDHRLPVYSRKINRAKR
jgi:hypothetical protein